MAISDLMEKLGKAIFEAPFDAATLTHDAPEMAEIRIAVLDAIKTKSHRVAGKDVFPDNVLRVHLLGIGEEQAPTFEGDFFARYIWQQVEASLERSGTRFPQDLRVEVKTTPKLPQAGEQWLTVETLSEAHPAESAPAVPKNARLTVTRGVANLAEIALEDKARVNIGRAVDVYRSDGPSRRNDLVFGENTEINRTVSREHAHILHHKKTGEYRLYNDRWYKPGKTDVNCGLWIMRDGLSQPVHRDARGARLRNGDEIHLGKAVVKFEAD